MTTTEKLKIDKIEITPEMIAAGMYELAYYNPHEDDAETAVVMIFRAMLRAAAKGGRLSGE